MPKGGDHTITVTGQIRAWIVLPSESSAKRNTHSNNCPLMKSPTPLLEKRSSASVRASSNRKEMTKPQA